MARSESESFDSEMMVVTVLTSYYDGLCDVTHASDYVTISNTYFHDHYKVSLVGHSDSNADEDTGHLTVTYANSEFMHRCSEHNVTDHCLRLLAKHQQPSSQRSLWHRPHLQLLLRQRRYWRQHSHGC